MSSAADTSPSPALRPVRALNTAQDSRTALIAEFELHLSTTANKHGRPFQRRTIRLQVRRCPAPPLANGAGSSGRFTDCDVPTPNRFFRWYYQEHDVPKSQNGKGGYTGGTNTVQRHLRALFTYLEDGVRPPEPVRLPQAPALRHSSFGEAQRTPDR